MNSRVAARAAAEPAMVRIALASLRGHLLRLVLTGLAIMVGTGFLAGTLVYGDTATAAFYQDLARAARNVDIAALPRGDDAARLPFSTVDTLAAMPGVASVEGRVVEQLPLLTPDGRLITDAGRVGLVMSLPANARLSSYGVAGGRLPSGSGEIAVDRVTVESYGFQLDGTVRALDRAGQPVALRLVGVLDVGANRRHFGQSIAALDAAELTRLAEPSGFREVVLAAAPGADRSALRGQIQRALGAGARVVTGDEMRRSLARQAAKYVDGFVPVLVAFGLVALTVSGFVIYNTFAILAAQRSRELALLRCLGAGRHQLVGAVLLEAFALGLVASLGGLVLSLLVGYGLVVSRGLVGATIPAHAPVLGGDAVIAALGLGVIVTVASALLPAIGVGRVSPQAALRETTAENDGATGPRWPRTRAASLLAGAGGAAALAGSGALARLTTVGILDGLPRGFGGLPLVLGGSMLVFLAFVLVAPLIVGRLVAVAGALPTRLLGAPARLGTANARRNPRRTAAVVAALVIGVALMSMLSVLLATARSQSDRELTENFPVDFVLTRAPFGGETELPDAVAAALRAQPAFAVVAGVRTREVSAHGRRTTAWAVEPGMLNGHVAPEVTDGSVAEFGPGQVAVARDLAAEEGIAVGAQITVAGTPHTVVALYDDTPVDAGVLLPWEDLADERAGLDRLLVDAVPTLSTVEVRRALDAALRDFPLVQVSTLAQSRADLGSTLDELLGIFAALLGTSVVIAMFGIGNTLTLSVLERTRESATLRALGLSRRQLRGMMLVEAALMAAVGAGIGVAFGMAVGWTAALGLIQEYGHGAPTVPFGQLLLLVTLAVVAAMLAGVLPARAATRAPIVSALTDT